MALWARPKQQAS